MKDLLKIKWELLVTPLYITLFILALIYVGVTNLKETIFTGVMLLMVPMAYVGTKLVRTLIYEVWIGSNINED